MAPRFRPSGWAGRDALLVGTRQRVRGCPRQLFVFAGSFATIRRRRLASPTSIVEIEATHPHVNSCGAARVRVRSGDLPRIPVIDAIRCGRFPAPEGSGADGDLDRVGDRSEAVLVAVE